MTRRGVALSEADLVLVLLHGPGVPGNDLARSADKLLRLLSQAVPQTTVVLPEGPLQQGSGRAWWSMPELSSHADPEKVSRITAPPLELTQRLVRTVRHVLGEGGERTRKLVLGGFSQGAVLATHCLLALRTQGFNASALLIFSGILDAGVLAQAASLSLGVRAAISIFVSHGEDDDVIPEVLVHRAIAVLQRAAKMTACPLSWHTRFHEGLHEIGDGTLESAASWIRSIERALPDARAKSIPEALAPEEAASSTTAGKNDKLETFGLLAAEAEEPKAADDDSSPEILPAPDPVEVPDMSNMSLEAILAVMDALEDRRTGMELQVSCPDEAGCAKLPPAVLKPPKRDRRRQPCFRL